MPSDRLANRYFLVTAAGIDGAGYCTVDVRDPESVNAMVTEINRPRWEHPDFLKLTTPAPPGHGSAKPPS